MKTVHGPEFYANKKHKGSEHYSCKQEKTEDPKGVGLLPLTLLHSERPKLYVWSLGRSECNRVKSR